MFKVGDKVKAVAATHGWGSVNPGDIGTVRKVESSARIIVDFKSQKEWVGRPRCFELVEEPWVPQPGEWVDVSQSTGVWGKRQFLVTHDGEHYCVADGNSLSPMGMTVVGFEYIRQIPTTKTIKLVNGEEIEISLESYDALMEAATK